MIAKHQPDWVCDDCGRKFGQWYIQNGGHKDAPHTSTYHVGSPCGVCRRSDVPVTEARDFGYLVEGWRPRMLKG